MAHIVTCQICHKKFDRDKEPFKKIAFRKYVHQSCYENASKNEKEITFSISWGISYVF